MANIISRATGNFTAAGTWGVVHAGSELDSEAGSFAITTGNHDSATFTFNGTDVISGVAVKIASRVASPTGTITLHFRNSTGGVNVKTVTINATDVHSSGLGWHFFKFDADVTPAAATNYLIRLTASVTSQVTVFRNATADNCSRKIATTTTQAPGAGDQIVICGELTGAGTGNDVTVTMNNTATTSFGPTVSGGPPQGIVVSRRGTLTWATSAATNYYLRWKGQFLICGGGVVNVGTSGARIPADSTAVLEMDSAANLDSFLIVSGGGTLNAYGATKTTQTQLTANASASATNLTVGDTTGWRANDKLAFTPTGTSASEYETKNVSTVGGSTSVTLSAGLSSAKRGTAPQQGYIVNLTRNIVIRGISTSLRGNFRHRPLAGATTYLEYVEFTLDRLGNNSTDQRCIDVQSIAGAPCTLKFCSGNPGGTGAGNNNPGVYVNGSSMDAFTIQDWVSYDWAANHITVVQPTTGTNWSVTDALGIRNSDATGIFQFNDVGGSIQRVKAFCSAQGSTGGLNLAESIDADYSATTFDGLEAAYCGAGGASGAGIAFGITGAAGIMPIFSLSNVKVWRNSNGLRFVDPVRVVKIAGFTGFGNGVASNNQTGQIQINQPARLLEIRDGTFANDNVITTLTTGGNGISIGAAVGMDPNIRLFTCTFGVASGIFVAHSGADVVASNAGLHSARIFANNCVFGSSTNFSNLFGASSAPQGDHLDDGGPYVRCQKFGQVAGDHRTFTGQATIRTDSVIFKTASPSERVTPSSATYRARSGSKRAPIANGATRTVSVWVRKSTTSDSGSGGVSYDGAEPRLVLRRNPAIGINSDVVLDTMTVAAGTWEQLSGTTATASDDGVIEVYVDCRRGASGGGWINVDDYAVS